MTAEFKLKTEKTPVLTNYGGPKDYLILIKVDDGEAAFVGTDTVDQVAEMMWDEKRFFELTIGTNEQVYLWAKQGRGAASVTVVSH